MRVLGTMAAALLGAILIACAASEEGGEAGAEPSYKEVVATRGPFRIAVSATGLVRPIDRIELKSKASGAVVQLPIEVGDEIAEGGLVAKLDQPRPRPTSRSRRPSSPWPASDPSAVSSSSRAT
jgi:HlyD family secretion protein